MNGASNLDTNALADRLRRREKIAQVKIWAMFIFGVPLTLVGPLTIATILWLASLSARQGWDIHWSWLFGTLAVVMIPLLYRLELRTGGEYYDTVMSQTEVYAPSGTLTHGSSVGGRIVALPVLAINARPVAAQFVEVFLLGPRLVLGAIRQRRIRRALVRVDFDRAVEIVRFLGSVDGGVDLPVVLRSGETLAGLLDTFAYLVFYHWIGVRGAWERIWLTSEARRSLSSATRRTSLRRARTGAWVRLKT